MNSVKKSSAQDIFWRTQSRARKSGKMCKRIRSGIGTALIIICLLLCIRSAVSISVHKEVSYESGEKQELEIRSIETEHNGMIAVNTADAEELTALPGIGETLAQMIIDERVKHGPYYYAEDLVSVRGIGSGTLNKFRDMIDLSQRESGE